MSWIRSKIAEIRARADAATEGPWAWFHVGEKVNGYVIGTAMKEDGTPVAGFQSDKDDLVDNLLYRTLIGDHEAATCNYADPDFITHARADVPFLLDELEAALDRIEHLEGPDIVFPKTVEQS